MQAYGAVKFRRHPRRPQQIGGERPAAGAELGHRDRRGLSHPLPDQGAPHADQFAENLAHLGGGDKIAGGADRPPGHVIPALRVIEGHRHERGDGQRSLGANPTRDLAGQTVRAHAVVGRLPSRAQRIIAIPAINSGIDSNWPIVVPKIR